MSTAPNKVCCNIQTVHYLTGEQVSHILFLHSATTAVVGIIHIIPAEGDGASTCMLLLPP